MLRGRHIALGLLSAACLTTTANAQQTTPTQPRPQAESSQRQGQEEAAQRPESRTRPDGQDRARPGQTRNRQTQEQRQQTQRQDAQQRRQSQQQGEQQDRIMLGVAINPNNSRDDGQGLEIMAIREGSSAADANLREGDRIISIDGQQVRSADQLDQAVQRHSEGDQVQLMILRNGQQQEISLTLSRMQMQQGDRSEQYGNQQNRGWLGVALRQDRSTDSRSAQSADRRDTERQGAEIARVYPASPAARAGLFSGDVITAVNDQQVQSNEELMNALAKFDSGETVQLTVQQGRQSDTEEQLSEELEEKISVRLGDANVFRGFATADNPGMIQQQAFRNWDDSDSSLWRDSDGTISEIPESAMQIEAHRRLAEQNQRLERMINELRDEVRELRNQMGSSGRTIRGNTETVPSELEDTLPVPNPN